MNDPQEAVTMNVFWGLLMAAAGMFMLVGGTTKSDLIVYRLLVARSQLLWGEGVHRVYQVSGLILVALGVLWAAGFIWTS